MTNGALFYRADLHIHSYGKGTGSFDVVDSTNTPQAIVDLAIEKGLKIISITDHNQYMNSFIAVQYSNGKDILVIPGIEVSTTQGHLLVYFDTIENLQHFYGHLTFDDAKSVCNQGIKECLDWAENYKGIGVLAHITLSSGFEKTINRFGPPMEQIFQCKNLVGLEITNKEDVDLYTDSDSDPNHKHLLEIWRNASENKYHTDFAKLMSSDSHELIKIGQNAEGRNRLTRIKMSTLTFRSFYNALLSSESRVRIEDVIPEQRPMIKHVKIEGGLLNGTDIELSPNLSCIIGSRGTGKSTLLESIRETSGNITSSKLCDSDVWPQCITLDYIDEVGQKISFQREKNSVAVNCSDSVNGITTIPIESYGQGDTANTIQHCDENPQSIIDFLDSFLNLELFKQQDREYVEQLRRNQSEMNNIRIDLLSLSETQKVLEYERKKFKALEASNAAEIVTYHHALIKEREFRTSLIQDLKKLIDTYKELLGDNCVFEKVAEMNDDAVIVGKDYFSNVKNIVNDFSSIVAAKSAELNSALNDKIALLRSELIQWQSKESEIQDKINAKKEELTRQGIPFDLGKINQISKDIIVYEKKVQKLLEKQKKLKELMAVRKTIIKLRQDNKKEITKLHLIFASKINNNLRNSIDDFFVSIKYKEDLYSPSFERTLKELMSWRTSQVPKASLIARQISIYQFVEAVKNKKTDLLKSLKNNDNQQLLRDEEISNIINTLNFNFQYEDFESLDYDDFPTITVTKHIKEDGKDKTINRQISQLSMGQQQSVLLGILLLSDSNKPLLIDQPEDNLDSEFIYKTIVSNLRKIKEYRQVIVVTHNPNIAILGDAELIIPLKSTSTRSRVIQSGSIDNTETIKVCCEILEGGEFAFKQRKNIYGF